MFSAATKSAAPVSAAKYIENFFQTWLRTGTGASATITTGLDASTNKALVWTKSRSAATNNKLTDTVRGATKALISNTTGAETTDTNGLTAFSSTGYTIGTDTTYNNSGATYVDWEFVATPKFFDVVTYTGDGVAGRTISHNLGSVPGCIIVKRLDLGRQWAVYHKSIGNQFYLVLNNTSAKDSSVNQWNNTDPTSTVFTVSAGIDVNSSGGTYVAYVFADNAGGFGLTGTDNVISCGSFTTDGFGSATVSLGYEPQWVMCKASSGLSDWFIFDNMRGWAYGESYYLRANSTPADTDTGSNTTYPTATGFQVNNVAFDSSKTYIYIAIRRGPMKTPTSGTSVFAPILNTGTGSAKTISGIGFAPDLLWDGIRNTAGYGNFLLDKLRGGSQRLGGYTTAAEVTESPAPVTQFGNTSVNISASGTVNDSGVTYVDWFFQRAPGFFDEVCYTGTGTYPQTINHNLGVAPELMIFKRRNANQAWYPYAKPVTSPQSNWYQNYGVLNTNAAFAADTTSFTTAPTSTAIQIDSFFAASGATYVCYLFASVAGVSKVGSYTGTGALQTINCGFTSGARFVLIKRTDSTGDWYVYDSARGITSGNDPYLLLNDTAAEVTGTNYVDTDTTGFKVTAAAPAGLNASGGTFVFLAVA